MREVDILVIGDGPSALGAVTALGETAVEVLVVGTREAGLDYPVFIGPRSRRWLDPLGFRQDCDTAVCSLDLTEVKTACSVSLPSQIRIDSNRAVMGSVQGRIEASAVEYLQGAATLVSPSEGAVEIALAHGMQNLHIRSRVILWCAGTQLPAQAGRLLNPVSFIMSEVSRDCAPLVRVRVDPDELTPEGHPTTHTIVQAGGHRIHVSVGRPELSTDRTSTILGPRVVDYSSSASSIGRVLIAGAAGGFHNVVTGEGFGLAYESGLLAGRAAAAKVDTARTYARLLDERFGSAAATSAETVKRNKLMMRAIAGAAQRPTPIRSRLAVMMCDIESSRFRTASIDSLPRWSSELVEARRRSRAEVARRVSTLWRSPAPEVVSPAGLPDLRLSDCLLALLPPQEVSREAVVKISAAMDITILALGLLAAASPTLESNGPDGDSGPVAVRNWFQVASVVALDYCLAQAACLCAEVGPEMVEMHSGWSYELMSLRMQILAGSRPTRDIYLEVFEYPFRVAHTWSGRTPDELEQFVTLGHLLAGAFYHREVAIMRQGRRGRLGLHLDQAIAIALVDAESVTPAHSPEDVRRDYQSALDGASSLTDTNHLALTELLRMCQDGEVAWS